jgi:hypothetical protein
LPFDVLSAAVPDRTLGGTVDDAIKLEISSALGAVVSSHGHRNLAASAFLATGAHRDRNLSRLPSKAGQLTFLRDAFVRFLRAFDVIFEFSAGVRQQLGDFVWPRGCMGEGHARERELYDLPYFELVHSDYRFSLPLDFESPRRTVLTSCPFSPAGATWRQHQSLKPPSFRKQPAAEKALAIDRF